ncbi:MAG: YciI family protein [Rubrivivax sp.]|nr:MAG: YciI family protein [Rubrivivax sp.]
MRFMIIVKATPETEAEEGIQTPDEALMKAMADYHEQLAQAGALLDGSGLKPSSKGWRISFADTGGQADQRRIIDGPFAETKELIAGYTLIQVRSREEALEWARRYPNPVGQGRAAELEVRELYELDDFGSSEQVDRMRGMAVLGQ